MKKYIVLCCFLVCNSCMLFSQETFSRLSGHMAIGQYPASLVVPSFNPIHAGVNLGIDRQWNKSSKHQILQSANLAYFYHPEFQQGVQLFSELKYRLQLKNGLGITPFAMGGGYVLSISDLTTLEWDETTQTYTENKFSTRNNWLISLGGSISYATGVMIMERPLTFFADYRIQVQGIIVRENIPILPYAPVRLGVRFPIHKISQENK